MWYYYWIFRISADSNTILNDFNLSMRQIETVVRNLFHFPVQSLIWFSTSQKVALKPSIQPDQNMVIPERQSGIHMNSSFEVSSYFGQAVVVPRYSHHIGLIIHREIREIVISVSYGPYHMEPWRWQIVWTESFWIFGSAQIFAFSFYD